jgi:hypothetical protein
MAWRCHSLPKNPFLNNRLLRFPNYEPAYAYHSIVLESRHEEKVRFSPSAVGARALLLTAKRSGLVEA